MKSRSKDRTPTTVNLTVKRRYLTEREVERLMDCARKHGRYGHREYPKDAHVFVSERGGPISPIGFHRLIQRVGEAAKMPFPIHPHMLRPRGRTRRRDGTLLLTLPSGRRLHYPETRLVPGKFEDTRQLRFKDNSRGAWSDVDAWYGVLVENVVHAPC